MNRDFKQLRTFLDGDDPFVVGGHQMSDIRRKERPVPVWTKNDSEVRAVLLRAFPRLETDGRQRQSAARWLRIIYLYFRLQYTHRQTAAEMGLTPSVVTSVTRSIRRVASGRRADGSGQLGGKRGRPKKIHAIVARTTGR